MLQNRPQTTLHFHQRLTSVIVLVVTQTQMQGTGGHHSLHLFLCHHSHNVKTANVNVKCEQTLSVIIRLLRVILFLSAQVMSLMANIIRGCSPRMILTTDTSQVLIKIVLPE